MDKLKVFKQIEKYHQVGNAEIITDIIELLNNGYNLKEYTAVEVLEKTAYGNRLCNEWQKIPNWLYDCIPYNNFCEYIESLEIIECGNDFIKVSDNEYYYIRDIVELVEGL